MSVQFYHYGSTVGHNPMRVVSWKLPDDHAELKHVVNIE